MAFDERDYLKESHIRSNEKNLEIYNPKEFRRNRQTDYDRLPEFTKEEKQDQIARLLIAIALCWIVYAIWKIAHS